jgi:hypothetical protein
MSYFKFILCFIIVSGIFSSALFADTTYATGAFKTNTAAIIKVKPVTLIEGNTPDTTFTFRTTNTVQTISFSLPARITSTAISSTQTPVRFLASMKRNGSLFLFRFPESKTRRELLVYSVSGRLLSKRVIGYNGLCALDFSKTGSGFLCLSLQSEKTIPLGNIISDPNGAFAFRNSEVSAGTIASAKAVYTVDVEAEDKLSFSTITGKQVELTEGANGTITLDLILLKDTTAVGKFKELVPESMYNTLFAKRYGLGKLDPKSDGKFDFFTYRSLIYAVDTMSQIAVEVWVRKGLDYCYKGVWKHKKTGQIRTFYTHPDYNADWAQTMPESKYATVDYATFCNDGNDTLRKRELSAFLANISHETTGMGTQDTAKIWGLYWREEVDWQLGSTALGYVDNSDPVYPPAAGKSYHGRGPIQISWNYNYGQVSEFLYGDKNILLKTPEKVLGDSAVVSFMTAIWFWMTPQNPKPSCHDVMVERWKPTAVDITNGRDKSRFGNTVNIINGNLECGNNNPNDDRVVDRIGFYKRYARIFQVSIESNCGCYMMRPY